MLNVKNPRCGELYSYTDLDIIFLPCITVARAACDSATRLPVFTLLLYRYFARLPYHHYHQRLVHQHRYYQQPWRIRHDFLFRNLVDVKTAVCWDVTSFRLIYIDQWTTCCLHLWRKIRNCAKEISTGQRKKRIESGTVEETVGRWP